MSSSPLMVPSSVLTLVKHVSNETGMPVRDCVSEALLDWLEITAPTHLERAYKKKRCQIGNNAKQHRLALV